MKLCINKMNLLKSQARFKWDLEITIPHLWILVGPPPFTCYSTQKSFMVGGGGWGALQLCKIYMLILEGSKKAGFWPKMPLFWHTDGFLWFFSRDSDLTSSNVCNSVTNHYSLASLQTAISSPKSSMPVIHANHPCQSSMKVIHDRPW